MGVLLCNAPSSDLRWLRTGARVAVKAFKIDVATLACSTEVARMPDVVEAEPAGSGDVPGFETVGDDTLRLACFFGPMDGCCLTRQTLVYPARRRCRSLVFHFEIEQVANIS